MVIIRVSNSSEKVMLSTVRRLRRLLRNALFVTKRVKVMRLRKAEQFDYENSLRGRSSPNCANLEDKAAVAVWTTGLSLRALIFREHAFRQPPGRQPEG